MKQKIILWCVFLKLLTMATQIEANPLISPMKIKLQISWEVMKSGFSSTTSASQSESFVETWIYSQNTIEGSFLESPRARVAVVGIGSTQFGGKLPTTLIIEKDSLIRLLGVDQPKDNAHQMPVFLSLSSESDDLSEIAVHSADDELISVAISLWR